MTKLMPIFALALVLVGCEATNNPEPSKPYGVSRYKNPPVKGDHFLKEMLAEPEAKPALASNTPSVAVAPVAPVFSTPVAGAPIDDASLQTLRQRYGIPDSSVIKDEDVNAMIRLYTTECLRLQERQH